MFCYVDSNYITNLYTAFKYMYTLAYCCDAYCTHVPVTIECQLVDIVCLMNYKLTSKNNTGSLLMNYKLTSKNNTGSLFS